MWKKYVRPVQASDDSVIRRQRFACWITKTHRLREILIAFFTATVVTRTRHIVTLTYSTYSVLCIITLRWEVMSINVYVRGPVQDASLSAVQIL